MPRVVSPFKNVLTEANLRIWYVEQRMSSAEIVEFLAKQNVAVHVSTVSKFVRSFGLTRNMSESRRLWDDNPLDYEKTFLTESLIEWLDGFLLGDGHLSPNATPHVRSARASIGMQHEECSRHFIAGFHPYCPSTRVCDSDRMKAEVVWMGQTKYHPDLGIHHDRWYKIEDGKLLKRVPPDVRITATSVMLWYLGDGSIVNDDVRNTVMLRLSTDGFLREDVEMLVDKLKAIGITCHRNGDNRIMVDARGVPKFFELIGRKSPVKCYDYKFNMPEWRFTAVRGKEAAAEVGMDYHRLMYLVKIGKVPCHRASERGRPRFLPEHLDFIRQNRDALEQDCRTIPKA